MIAPGEYKEPYQTSKMDLVEKIGFWTVDNLDKKLHLRCLTRFWKRLWVHLKIIEISNYIIPKQQEYYFSTMIRCAIWCHSDTHGGALFLVQHSSIGAFHVFLNCTNDTKSRKIKWRLRWISQIKNIVFSNAGNTSRVKIIPPQIFLPIFLLNSSVKPKAFCSHLREIVDCNFKISLGYKKLHFQTWY